jgi:arylsulfatase
MLSIQLHAQTPPNVILIITDDQGFGDLGYHGNPQIKTPTLDQFAAESIRFTNFYVSPVCAPTRSSLMTGRYNIRTGVFDTYCGGAMMAAEEVTMAEIFRDAGYATGQFGKWHLGDNYPFRPMDQGFETAVWHQSGGMAQVGDVPNWHRRDSAYFDPILWRNDRLYQSKGYCTDVFTDEAIDFIRQNQEKPFFAYLAYNAPHTPLQVPQSYYDQYKDLKVDPSYFADKGLYTHEVSEAHQEAARGVFAMVTNIDDNIKKLLDSLDEMKLSDNTIIIFMTDNGPQQWRYVGGYRGTKGMVREGGIHVPFYLNMPEGMARVKQVDEPAAHIDLLPTLISLCGIAHPNDLAWDGKDISAFLQNENAPGLDRPLFFEWQRSYPELYRNMAVIKDGYKLMGFTGRDAAIGDFELYHLKTDPYEAKNIVEDEPAKATALKKQMEQWHADIMASPNIQKLPRIIIGSPHENPSHLNRNDARGIQIIWAQPDVHVSWDVTVAKAGDYRMRVRFVEPLPTAGQAIFRIGHQNFTLDNEATDTDELVFDRISLEAGDFTIDGWYATRGQGILTPFAIEVERL